MADIQSLTYDTSTMTKATAAQADDLAGCA
jgi:hypothetical protein